MATKEDLINEYEGHRVVMYNNRNSWNKKEISYEQFKHVDWAYTLMKTSVLVRLSELEGLPESTLRKYRLNNDDPEIQKARLDLDV